MKMFPCFVNEKVLCAFRKTEGLYVMGRCLTCPEYRRFAEEMEREEDEFFEECERIWKHGYPKRFDVPRGES